MFVSSKANPADCVDMSCDGHRKALIKDSDGSFLGAAGDALSQAEYQWDGDARYGLGDYRIPKPMLTYPDGTKANVDVLAKYKGMIFIILVKCFQIKFQHLTIR